MKLFTTRLLLAVIFAVALSAGQPNIATATVSLTSGSATNILALTSSSGVVTGLQCQVITGVSGSPYFALSVTVDGSFYPMPIGSYPSAPQWDGPQYTGTGQYAGDWFFIPLHLPFTSSVTIAGNSIVASRAGALSCTAYYN